MCALSFSILATVPAPGLDCPERPPCRGCGCKGGTGYRAPDGRCVGFAQLTALCGTPPEARCRFENAPGTGANRDCALAPRPRRARSREVPRSEPPAPPDRAPAAPE